MVRLIFEQWLRLPLFSHKDIIDSVAFAELHRKRNTAQWASDVGPGVECQASLSIYI